MKKYLIFLFISFILFTSKINAEEIIVSEENNTDNITINYQTHVQDYGWQDYVNNGNLSGTQGKSKRLEGIRINVSNTSLTGNIVYQTHVQDYGWQGEVNNNQMSGTEGKSKRLEGIKIYLTGELADNYDVYYKTHIQDYGWLDWAKNGELSGSEGLSKRLEAINIVLIKKGNSAPGSTERSYMVPADTLTQQGYVQDYGLLSSSTSSLIGTTGKGKRLEAFKMNLKSYDKKGSIVYSSYIMGDGWQQEKSNGSLSGTTWQSKSLEVVKMNLTDQLAEYYDIYYRVHVSSYGWLGWAKNGEMAGTLGYKYKIEAIEVKLVKKGLISGNTNNHYMEVQTSLNYAGYTNNKWAGITNNIVGSETGNDITSFKANLVSKYLGNLYYSVYDQNNGWTAYQSNNTAVGQSGLPVEGLKIKLDKELAVLYNIYYRVYIDSIGWLDWASNDQITGYVGYGKSIKAIELKLLEKSSDFTDPTTNLYSEKQNYLTYQGHVQNIGWQNYTSEQNTIGTSWKGLRLEALKIRLNNPTYSGTIEYQTHVQDYGWLNWVSNNQLSGTEGKSKRIESIKIRLTEEMADYYDIYYRAYIEDYGWLDWAKNGEIAGSVGLSKRMEAMQIVLIEKNGDAPGNTELTYIQYGWKVINGNKYFFDNNAKKVTGFKVISGIKYFFNDNGVLKGTNVKQIIDVSSHQTSIDWNQVKKAGVDGSIVRIGYGTSYESEDPVDDIKFKSYLDGSNSVGLLFGTYLYSYAIDEVSAKIEANFVINRLNLNHVDKSKIVYYDLESNNWTKNLTSSDYDKIIKTFIDTLAKAGYTAKVYTYKNLAETKFSAYAKSQLTWVAQYADNCNYSGSYEGWQQRSDGYVNGVYSNNNNFVDISVWYK